MGLIMDCADEDADVIFGTSTDESLPEDYVKITIVATGFEKDLKAVTTNNEHFINEAHTHKAIIRPRLVVGGDLDGNHLDFPSYLRNQQD